MLLKVCQVFLLVATKHYSSCVCFKLDKLWKPFLLFFKGERLSVVLPLQIQVHLKKLECFVKVQNVVIFKSETKKYIELLPITGLHFFSFWWFWIIDNEILKICVRKLEYQIKLKKHLLSANLQKFLCTKQRLGLILHEYASIFCGIRAISLCHRWNRSPGCFDSCLWGIWIAGSGVSHLPLDLLENEITIITLLVS